MNALDVLALATDGHRNVARNTLSEEEYDRNTQLCVPVLTLLQRDHPELMPLDVVRVVIELVSRKTNDEIKLSLFMTDALDWIEAQSKGEIPNAH